MDFVTQPATTLSQASVAGAANIKVGGVAAFAAGQTVMIDTGANLETKIIAVVGTAAGGASASDATEAGATAIAVANGAGFNAGQSIGVDDGANQDAAVVVSVANGRGGARITVAAPLAHAHAAGAQVSGTGITLSSALAKAHASGAQVVIDTRRRRVRPTHIRRRGRA